jgi:mono/diheme cytochrome c family protein
VFVVGHEEAKETQMRIAVALLAGACTGVALVTGVFKLSDRPAEAAPSGAAIYQDRCAICHESSGAGVPGAFPPLAQNPHVTAQDPSAAIATVLNGMLVNITVRGRRYVGGMPGWRDWLSDGDVAAVVTYIRTAWGNRASAVSAAQVARIRATSSTATP